jgi:hypothetical protein
MFFSMDHSFEIEASLSIGKSALQFGNTVNIVYDCNDRHFATTLTHTKRNDTPVLAFTIDQ